MIEVAREGRSGYHLETLTKLSAILLQSPVIFACLAHAYRCMVRQKAMLDKLYYFGTLLLAIDECLCHRIGVERSDSGSTLISDVFSCLVHCL